MQKEIDNMIRERMEDLAALALKKGRVSSMRDWCEKIDLNSRRISQIRKGTQQYTVYQLHNACSLVGINHSYAFGFGERLKGLEKYREELHRRGRRW